MKSTGVTRQLDALGRIVLPVEIRRTLGIGPKDTLEILVDGSSIVLRRFEADCHFCGNKSGLMSYKGRLICRRCLKELKSL